MNLEHALVISSCTYNSYPLLLYNKPNNMPLLCINQKSSRITINYVNKLFSEFIIILVPIFFPVQ